MEQKRQTQERVRGGAGPLHRDGVGEVPHHTAAVSTAIPPPGPTPGSRAAPWAPSGPSGPMFSRERGGAERAVPGTRHRPHSRCHV